MEEQIIIITKFCSCLFWQLTALLFLIGSFIMFALPRSLITSSFYVALFLIFIICEYMSLKRKRELKNE